MADTARILLVDDDVNILNGFKRNLYRDFKVQTATDAADGLQCVEQKGPFSVVVSDQQMPGMKGIEFLSKVRKIAPLSTRIMLTGNADLDTAVKAVNEGAIYRFLSKPCGMEDLARALKDGARQHALLQAEKTLLEKTLVGSVSVMTDVLAMTEPETFRQVSRVRHWAEILLPHVGGAKPWVVKTAIMLSGLGTTLLPPDLKLRIKDGDELSAEEQATLATAPRTAHDLLQKIPHFSEVAEAILYHRRGYDGTGFPSDGPSGADLPLAARLLKVLLDLNDAAAGRSLKRNFFKSLLDQPAQYDPELLKIAAVKLLPALDEEDDGQIDVSIFDLQEGDMLVSDVMTEDGKLLLASGHQVTETFLTRIRQAHKLYRVQEPIAVQR